MSTITDTNKKEKNDAGNVTFKKNERFGRLKNLRKSMADQEIQAAVLTYAHSIAALFDGAQIFNGTRPEPPGRACVIVTSSNVHVMANKTECTRISEEELSTFPDVIENPINWDEWDRLGMQEAFNKWIRKQGVERWWADSFGPKNEKDKKFLELIKDLMYPLNETDIGRIKDLGHLVSATLVETATLLKPGISEAVVAASIHERLLREGALPDLVFVAFDERIARYRHCKPGTAGLTKTALLSITASKKGLYTSATRLTSIGPAPETLKEETRIANEIETAAIHASYPGNSLENVFEVIKAAYKKHDLPEGWREHHLGGPSGFQGRDAKVAPGKKDTFKNGQPFVYNPVFKAGKSEDTFFRMPETGELLCLTEDNLWPRNRVVIPGAQPIERPGVLEISAI